MCVFCAGFSVSGSRFCAARRRAFCTQRRVVGVTLQPGLVGPRVKLGECVLTRLLGTPLQLEGDAADAEALELPLKLGSR